MNNILTIMLLGLLCSPIYSLQKSTHKNDSTFEQARMWKSCFAAYFPGGVIDVLESKPDHLASYATCVKTLRDDLRDSKDDIRMIENDETVCYYEPVEFRMSCSQDKRSEKIECWQRIPIYGGFAPEIYGYGYKELKSAYFTALKKLHQLTHKP